MTNVESHDDSDVTRMAFRRVPHMAKSVDAREGGAGRRAGGAGGDGCRRGGDMSNFFDAENSCDDENTSNGWGWWNGHGAASRRSPRRERVDRMEGTTAMYK